MNFYKLSAVSLFFIGAGILFFITRLFLKTTIEINLYNTYFIISKKMLATGIAGVMLVFALIYVLFSWAGYALNTKLGILHLVITVFGALILVSAPVGEATSGDYQKMRQNMAYLTRFCLAGFVVFCLGQVILAVNIARIFFGKISW